MSEIPEPQSPWLGALRVTYPLPDVVATLRANAKRTGTELRKARGGAFVWVNPDSPTSAYLAEPRSGYEVEVYDPEVSAVML